MKRTLIINADDLGYTVGINRAVVDGLSRGAIGSATLMANGPAFEEAVSAIKRSGVTSIGVHLVLTELKPVAHPHEVPDLVDERGLLVARPATLVARLAQNKISMDSIRRELDRQVRKVLDHGIFPTHLDSHKHVHVLPQVLEPVMDIALRYSIGWIRSPFDGMSCWKAFSSLGRDNRLIFSKQCLMSRLMWLYRPAFLELVRRSGLRTVDHFYGVSLTGVWNMKVLPLLVAQMPLGLSEWMIHPGYCDDELKRRATRLLEQREQERNLFCSDSLRALLMKNGIVLARYGEI